jgi:hypothetical protein
MSTILGRLSALAASISSVTGAPRAVCDTYSDVLNTVTLITLFMSFWCTAWEQACLFQSGKLANFETGCVFILHVYFAGKYPYFFFFFFFFSFAHSQAPLVEIS